MSTQAERTEIAVLQTQMTTVQKDVNDIKFDIKDIKNTLTANLVAQNQSLVPRNEFEAFKKSVRINYILIVLITAAITALVYNFFGVHGK